MSDSALPVLFSFRRCPYAMRARMAIAKAGVAVQLREVVLRNKPVQMVDLSAKATVPVLQLSNGDVIDESLDVMLWALSQSDPDAWLQDGFHEALELIEENDGMFKPLLDRYKYFVNYPQHSQQDYREQAAAFFELLELQLAQRESPGLVGARIGLADVAIFPFIRQFAHVDLEWFSQSKFARLIAWFQNFERSELYLNVMKKYPAWNIGDATTVFPERNVKQMA